MAVSNQSRQAAVAVTTQPRQRHPHLELATLTKAANPKAAIDLGDWSAPPPPPTDYGNGGGGSDSYRHRHKEAWAAGHLTVGWGLWTIGELIGDCLVGQISKARSKLGDSKPVYGGTAGSSNSTSSSGSGAKKRSSARKQKRARKLSDYTLIATVQVLLGSEHGTTSSRRVTFNTVPEVKYVDKCVTLYPPTLKGIEMKREAFWSKRELQDNEAKWEGHLETYELGRNGRGTTCQCLGCVADGEDTNF